MFWPLFVLFAILFAVWFGFQKYLKRNYSYWDSRNVKFFDLRKLYSAFDGILLRYTIDQSELKTYNAVKNEGIKTFCGLVEFGAPAFYVVDPELMKTIMIKDFDSFVDRRIFATGKTDIFAKMVSNMKGQVWKDMRATMSPTFSTGKIRRMYSVFNDSSNKLADFLRKQTSKNQEFELRDVFTRYTMDVISSAAFGLDAQSFQNSDSDFSKYTKRFQNQFSGIGAFKFLVAFFSPKILEFFKISLMDKEASDFFANVVKRTIAHRDSTGEKRQDFLQLMMEARQNSIEPVAVEEMSTFEKDAEIQNSSKMQLTEELILAQSLLFFIGGFDTIETLLLLAAYELALNQDVQDKLFEELKAAYERNNGQLTYDVVMQLEYLEKVTSETLRKWPPGIRLERKSTKSYKVPNSDAIIDPDTLVVLPIYGIHMDEQYYPEPEKFDPERFSAENKAKRHPFTYLPFGAGPRNCIAMRFALAEGKAAIAHLILNFKLEPSAKTEIPLKFKTMSPFKPANGLWLRVTPRN